MFIEENSDRLDAFARLSQAAGGRSDYVQGGGGNTSVKLPGGLMAIKASGFRLADIRRNRGYVVLNQAAIAKFYRETQPQTLQDVEAAGSACVKANTVPMEGLAALRPSVEAGFHSICKDFVLHTHSVYANLAACSAACRTLAQIAFQGADYTWGWVPYTDPGARLTFAIRDEMARVESETGKSPSVILMQNHGIIVQDDDPDRCLAIHTDANHRLARMFDLTGVSFPPVQVEPLPAGFYRAKVPGLAEKLRTCDPERLLQYPLYPDQMVFFADTLFFDRDTMEPGQAVIDRRSGEMLLWMDEKKAMALTETVAAVLFILEHVERCGYALSVMGRDAQAFIAGWESEKYRKAMAGNRP